MKRKGKPRRGEHGPVTPGNAPLPGHDDEPIDARPDSPGGPPSQAVEQVSPDESRDPGQTDIERADERKHASIETVPHPDPSSGVVGFIEPSDPEPSESP